MLVLVLSIVLAISLIAHALQYFCNRRLSNDGNTDSLTGLLSPKGLEVAAKQVFTRFSGLVSPPYAKQHRRRTDPDTQISPNLAYIEIDLRGLSCINTKFHERTGNQVLKDLAGMVKESTRAGEDVIGRAYYRGDEIVILADGGLDALKAIWSNLNKRVHARQQVDPLWRDYVSLHIAAGIHDGSNVTSWYLGLRDQKLEFLMFKGVEKSSLDPKTIAAEICEAAQNGMSQSKEDSSGRRS